MRAARPQLAAPPACSCEYGNASKVSLEGLRVGYATDFWAKIGNETEAAFEEALAVGDKRL